MNHDRFVHVDAAYLFDALEPDERAEYESHLATCAECRAALDQLGPVMQLLDASDEQVLDPPAPPVTLLPGLLAAARREVRRRRVRVAVGVAAAACVAVLGIVAFIDRAPLPPARAMSAVSASPVSATARLRPTDWGTEISVDCWYRAGTHPQPGYSYALRVRSRDGASYSLGTWRLGPHKHLTFTSGTSLSADRIDRISITDSEGTEILTLANR
jgi:hypothetical protein